MDKLEKINCPICDIDNTKLRYDIESLSVVICNQCKLWYVNPRIKKTTLEKEYVETYYPDEKMTRINSDKMEWLQMSERLSELEKKCPSYGRILDVGCGIGTFLHLANINGWETYGIDPSKNGSAYAQEIHQLNVQCGDVFDAKFPDGHFDVITLYHVLEHISDLNPFLSELRRILKPNTGKLVIEVPNGGSLHSRIQKSDWPYIHPHDHLYYFSTNSLSSLLKKNEFKNIEVGKPTRVGIENNLRFNIKLLTTAILVKLNLGTVIRLYAG